MLQRLRLQMWTKQYIILNRIHVRVHYYLILWPYLLTMHQNMDIVSEHPPSPSPAETWRTPRYFWPVLSETLQTCPCTGKAAHTHTQKNNMISTTWSVSNWGQIEVKHVQRKCGNITCKGEYLFMEIVLSITWCFSWISCSFKISHLCLVSVASFKSWTDKWHAHCSELIASMHESIGPLLVRWLTN